MWDQRTDGPALGGDWNSITRRNHGVEFQGDVNRDLHQFLVTSWSDNGC